jgi:hypothetical protein
MTDCLVHVGRLTCIASIVTILSGCIALPLPTVTGIPDIDSQLPEDLRKSELDALVLTTHTKVGRGSNQARGRLGVPIFMKAKNLGALTDIVWLEESVNLIGVGVGYGVISPFALEVSAEYLGTLCIVVSDGRTFTFSRRGSQLVVKQENLPTVRRDAIVSALQALNAIAFAGIDGPCDIGVMGTWPQDVNSRVIDFLLRLPKGDTALPTAALAQLFESGVTPGGEKRVEEYRVMLLGSTKWRDTTVAEAPMFLSATDIRAAMDLIVASKPDEIMPFFPSFKSGARSPSRLELDRLCAIGSDGRAAWWSEGAGTWIKLGANPPYREWIADVMLVLHGEPAAGGWAEHCPPRRPATWSAEERRQVATFLQRVPSQEFKGLSDLLAKVGTRVASGEAQLSTVMVVTAFAQAGLMGEPVFLRTNDASALVDAVRSLTPRQLMTTLVPAAADRSDFAHVCVVSAEGNVTMVESDRPGWRMPRRSEATALWRNDALAAMRQQFEKYGGSFVCYLHLSSAWSEETRKRAIDFFEAMSVKDTEPR